MKRTYRYPISSVLNLDSASSYGFCVHGFRLGPESNLCEACADEHPCHKKPRSQWCDHSGPGGFMGHTCGLTPRALPQVSRREYYDLLPLDQRLHPQQQAFLVRIAEEASEVAKAATKILRFGLSATHHETGKAYDNFKDLLVEVADLNGVMGKLTHTIQAQNRIDNQREV